MKTLDHETSLARRLFLSGACTLAVSGCWGSFGAARALWDWNDGLGSKWVKWLVFVGLSIIPVYELFVIADAFVINSIEFWSGSNPVKKMADGRTITRVATADPRTQRIEVRRDGRLESVIFVRRLDDGQLELLDATGRRRSMVREQSDGSLELWGKDQVPLTRLDAAAAERVYARVEQGDSVHSVLQRELGERAWQMARLGGDSAVPSQLL
jgi:hypothetical protein